jgi:hypothetical protein
MKDKVDFGDAMDVFSQLKDGDLHKKLEESMENIGSFFEKMENPDTDTETETPSAKMPKMEDLHENMQKMFDGKIGKLAKELAEDMGSDLAASFGEDMKGVIEAYVDGLNYYASLHQDELVKNLFPVTEYDIVAGFVFRTQFLYGLDYYFVAVGVFQSAGLEFLLAVDRL